MGNAIAGGVEDPPPPSDAANACAACVDLGEAALLNTLHRTEGVADSEIVATLRWELPKQSLATNGCELQASCFAWLGGRAGSSARPVVSPSAC